jgi:quercetin dioxygenase-like cupin family protein
MPEDVIEARDDVVVDPVLRQRHRFTRRTDERGELLEINSWVEPGGGVTPHVHPTMDERFTVVSGRCSFLGGRRWTEASAGESVDVPAGARHAYRNDGDEVAHIVCEARPPQTLEEFLTDTAALSRAGKITRQGFPRGWDGILAGVALVHGYRDMVELGFPLPPQPVQRVLFPPLVRIAERRGYRPGNFQAALERSIGPG